MYYSMPLNMFFIVKNHWAPYFTDNPRIIFGMGEGSRISLKGFKQYNKVELEKVG
jgi:hypothetical protein